jgi:hypothetical protein
LAKSQFPVVMLPPQFQIVEIWSLFLFKNFYVVKFKLFYVIFCTVFK